MAIGSHRGIAAPLFPVCPLTLDYGAFQQSLDAVRVHTIPLGGSKHLEAHSGSAHRASANVREATKS